MPRTARPAPEGMVYHVLNRGVGKQKLFHKDEDYLAFERVIVEKSETGTKSETESPKRGQVQFRGRNVSITGPVPVLSSGFGCSRKGPWRLSKTSGLQQALSNQWLAEQGLFSLLERWSELAPKRRTA